MPRKYMGHLKMSLIMASMMRKVISRWFLMIILGIDMRCYLSLGKDHLEQL